jgi:uncharacterized repeat protein (TIGR03803 family)
MKERAFAMVLGVLLLATSAAHAQTESVLYSFCSIEEGGICLDGEYPSGGLIRGNDGNLYGTTFSGGAGASILYGYTGSGTVFKLTPSGTLTTLYSFCSQSGCTDGAFPEAPLIQGSDGNFYGTTSLGGTGYNPYSGEAAGTVFKITPSGTLTTLYSFCSQSGCADGASPYAALIQASDGNFYGTTDGLGPNLAGTIFKLTPAGTVSTLYSFCSVILSNGYCYDGPGPYAALILADDGNFYGTSWSGGTNGASGTVFKFTPAGTLTIVYPFCRKTGDRDNFCIDGEGPDSGVIQATNGDFYGTTTGGGDNGDGNAFKLTRSGALTACRQTDCPSGHPAGLIQASDGNFYGTTMTGGAANGGDIFKLTPAGRMKILYSFCTQRNSQGGCPDGFFPYAALIQVDDGNFYGTTNLGGAYGGGTVFTLSVPPTTLTVSPAKMNFGKVDTTGTNKPKKLTLNNKGNEPTTIGQLSAPASFTIISDTCSNTTLASKEECTVAVAFAPVGTVGSVSETLDIPYSYGSNSGNVAVPLTGKVE